MNTDRFDFSIATAATVIVALGGMLSLCALLEITSIFVT